VKTGTIKTRTVKAGTVTTGTVKTGTVKTGTGVPCPYMGVCVVGWVLLRFLRSATPRPNCGRKKERGRSGRNDSRLHCGEGWASRNC
jgi:hypothetical protein